MRQLVLLIVFTVLSVGLAAQAKCPCTPVVSAVNTQTLHHVVPDGAGGAIVAWQDLRNGADWDIYAQRVDAYGNMLWVLDGILICGAPQGIPGYQGHLCITPSGADFIIAWEDSRVNGINLDIYAQKIDLNGNALWGAGGIAICAHPADQILPQICDDGVGGAFITWYENRGGAAVDYDTYALRVDTNGLLFGAPMGTLLSCSGASLGSDQFMPVICSNNNGGAYIAYESVQPQSMSDIYLQEVDPFCAIMHPGEIVVCAAIGQQLTPKIISDQLIGAIICWEDYRVANDIYIEGVTGGIITWSAGGGIPVAPTGSGSQWEPSLTSGGPNTAIVAWKENASPIGDIFVQQLIGPAPVVTNWGPIGIPVCGVPGDQVFPQVCPDGNNGVFIVWEDRRDVVTPSYDIYGEQLDVNGNIIGGGVAGSGVALCTFAGYQRTPMLANSQPNKAIYVYADDRNFPLTGWDLYTLDPIDPTLPVVLSSFSATITASNTVQLKWTTQSESNISGFYLQRNTNSDLSNADFISPLIQGTNTSQQVSYSFTDEDVMMGTTYYYWLQSVEYGGHTDFYGPVHLTLPNDGDINGTPEIPVSTGINSIYPNPFNPLATISIGVTEADKVNVTVYNGRGQKIRNIFDAYLDSGTYRCFWNGTDDSGALCPSGIYYIKMTAGKQVSFKKAVLSK